MGKVFLLKGVQRLLLDFLLTKYPANSVNAILESDTLFLDLLDIL